MAVWQPRSICMFCCKPIGSIFKTVLVTTTPAQSYFWPKSGEHDVTLTSFTANLSEPRNISLVRVCKIDEGRCMQSLLAISHFVLSYGKKSGGGGAFRPPPPSGRGLMNTVSVWWSWTRAWDVNRVQEIWSLNSPGLIRISAGQPFSGNSQKLLPHYGKTRKFLPYRLI